MTYHTDNGEQIERRDTSEKGATIRQVVGDARAGGELSMSGGNFVLSRPMLARLLSECYSLAFQHGRAEVVAETRAVLPKQVDEPRFGNTPRAGEMRGFPCLDDGNGP